MAKCNIPNTGAFFTKVKSVTAYYFKQSKNKIGSKCAIGKICQNIAMFVLGIFQLYQFLTFNRSDALTCMLELFSKILKTFLVGKIHIHLVERLLTTLSS